MQSESNGRLDRLRLDIFLRPMPPALFAAAAVVVLIVGAAYCSGYEKLLTNRDNWPGSLLWAGYALLPWLLLFEIIKRREWDADRELGLGTLSAWIVATAILSLAAEFAVQGLDSIALPLMRRLPGLLVFVLLIGLSRREQRQLQRRLSPQPQAGQELAELERHAPAIRWIQAADNYLELHAEGRVMTRRITMRAAEAALQPLGFVRVHRSVIVNRRHVDRIVPRSGGPEVQMVDGTALPTGRAFNANLRQLH